MPRKQRENVEHGIYHAYARGNDRAVIYRDDADRHIYLRLLRQVVAEHEWWCLAYCLMPNHLHLLVETPTANLSAGMQRLQSRYAQEHNIRHERSGHVFQGRFGAVRIENAGQLCTVAAYIARNPIEAGLCAQPEEWQWSSFRAVMDGGSHALPHSKRLLSYFSDDPEAARAQYSRMAVGADDGT